MEEIGTTILSTSHYKFYGALARKTIPLTPIHSFTKQVVPSLYQQSDSLQLITLFLHTLPINALLPLITFLSECHFFFCFPSFIFITHFRELAGACVTLEVFSFCAFTCLSNNSLIS